MIRSLRSFYRTAEMSRSVFAFAPTSSALLLRHSSFINARPLHAALSPRVAYIARTQRGYPAHFSTGITPQANEQANDHHVTPTSKLASAYSKNGIPVLEHLASDTIGVPEFDEAQIIDEEAKPEDIVASGGAVVETEEPEESPPPGMGPALSTFRLSPVTVDLLAKNGIKYSTDVQAGTFNLLYDGRDIIAKSRTGTGKTLAFALPILEKLAIHRREKGRMERGEGPGCIVLAPTRELAKQVAREMSYIGKGLGLYVDCFYGGASYNTQENALRRGLDVVVGTPGRIIDHLDRGTLSLENIKFAVLDEADEMLSMGFSDDVENIFQTLPPKDERQVILFSATVPRWVKSLASQYQKPDVELFDSVSTGVQTATTVRHCAVRVPETDEARASLLADIIAVYCHSAASEEDQTTPSRAIVFTQTKKEADELVACGCLDGCGAAVLHGDVSQRQRETTLAQFRSGRFQVLVATDVAARGLDISGVDVVVQYRVPNDAESYIHRSGRTGRAGRNGTAVVLFNEREVRSLRELEYSCNIEFERRSAPAPEMALDAAVNAVVRSSKTVDERVLKHLMPSADEIVALPKEELRSAVAGLLAVAGRRTKLEDRSVLSGETGMRTLIVRGKRDLTRAMAMRCLSNLAEGTGERMRVGLIRICQDGSAVVDVPSKAADKVLEVAENGTDLDVQVATSIPPLREDEYRSADRRGRGRDSYGRGRMSNGPRYRRDDDYGYRGRRERYSRDGYSRDGGDRYRGRERGDRGYRRSGGGYGRRTSALHDDF